VLVEPRAGTSQPEHPARARTWRSLAATLRLPCTPGGSVGTGHAGGRRREGIGTPPPGVAAERVSARHAMSSRTAATHSRRSAQREGTASAASPLQVARAVPQPRVGTRRDPTTSELRGGPQLGATDERLAVLVVRLAAARLRESAAGSCSRLSDPGQGRHRSRGAPRRTPTGPSEVSFEGLPSPPVPPRARYTRRGRYIRRTRSPKPFASTIAN
jgi:hypothetical protein